MISLQTAGLIGYVVFGFFWGCAVLRFFGHSRGAKKTPEAMAFLIVGFGVVGWLPVMLILAAGALAKKLAGIK